MGKKFSISDGMLNSISKNVKVAEELKAKDNFKVEYIDIKNIIPNKENFYDIVDIDSLAEDININGLNHNLVVRKLDKDNYEIISGERRYTALKKLVEEGESRFSLVPCKVIDVNDLDSEIILIQSNAQTRELTEIEKLEQVKRLTELYKKKKEKGEKVGRIRDLISKDLKLSPTQVGRYDSINRKLISELKELLEKGDLNIANASEFASLSEDSQRIILDLVSNEVNLSKSEAIKLKNDMKKVEKEKEDFLKSEKLKIEEEHNKALMKEKERNEKLQKEVEELKNSVTLKGESEKEAARKLEEIKKKEEELKENEKSLKDKEKSINDNKDKLKDEIERKAKEKYLEEMKRLKDEKEREAKENKELKEKIQQSKKADEAEKENLKLILKISNINKQFREINKEISDIGKDVEVNKEIKFELKKLMNTIKEIEDTIQLKTEQVEL